MAKNWYVVHTYSGYEQKAKQALLENIKQNKMESLFDEILIPSEDVVEMKKGVKKTSKRNFFPGYILVKMELNEKTWHVVKGTPKVTGFVGGSLNPPVVPEEEVRRITKQIEEGTLKPKPKILFEKGEDVRVVNGPFATFSGIVDEVNEGKGKLRVMVSIFGRSTPIELDFTQVEKV
ncbi:MAG: transcription termination/antitermination protein NusG [Deltaproteobacteria bacterium]|nr:transcription termination/antitermination protein NusG [Deltaproteobacteria bacterium]MBI2341758.1 transcription termination/antitermination protein NusG [Deltaproteobacteria bacterium]MBI2975237.1 transcription termination/antitermination protein NusG [Deltaproteobacteria bacterium]